MIRFLPILLVFKMTDLFLFLQWANQMSSVFHRSLWLDEQWLDERNELINECESATLKYLEWIKDSTIQRVTFKDSTPTWEINNTVEPDYFLMSFYSTQILI